MDKTEYIKELITGTGMSIKAFANECGIPYTTLRSMLERGIESIGRLGRAKKNKGIQYFLKDIGLNR